MNDCHSCRYELAGERSPYHRCLLVYGEGIAVEKLKDGLIGRCADFKPIAEPSGTLRRMASDPIGNALEGEKE